MLIRRSREPWLSWNSVMIALPLLVISLIALTSAAPVIKEKAAVKDESDKPLVRAKRADEIIFDNVQNVAADPLASSPVKKSDQQVVAKPDDVTKPESSPPIAENSKPETVNQNEAEAYEGIEENSASAGARDSSESGEDYAPSAGDSSESATWDADNEDAEKRRRRRAADTEATSGREKRAASAPMVAENMAAAGSRENRLQRAKRDLDADEIREILESRQPLVESIGQGRGLNYEEPYYGSPRDYVEASDDQQDGGEEDGGDYEDEEEEEGDEGFDVGRPKRRSGLTDEEREEALEEAERQVVRELLAERVAEETRQALINYLSGFSDEPRAPLMEDRRAERFDERFRDGFPDEEGYEEEEESDEDNSDEENGYEGDEEGEEGQERIEDGDGRFLVEDLAQGDSAEEVDEQSSPSIAEQKRFSFPYSYEPYGGRWGAIVPGAKRDEHHDPYDRLYQLAEVLSRPSSIGGGSAAEDEYKK